MTLKAKEKRNMRYVKVLSLVVCCFALTCSSAFCAELVLNGGFETGNLDNWTQTGVGTIYAVSTVDPHSGSFSVEGTFNEGGLGGLTQNIALPGNTEIVAGFWYKALGTQWAWGASYAEASLVEFDIGGNVVLHNYLALLGLDYPTPAGEWTQVTKTITTGAATVSAQIYINGQVLPGDQLFADDFSVDAIPEPSGLLLIASGIVSLIARRRLTI